MPQQYEITIKFTVDRDAVPGWGHKPEDWIDLATSNVLRQSHYNTKAEVLSITTLSSHQRQDEGGA